MENKPHRNHVHKYTSTTLQENGIKTEPALFLQWPIVATPIHFWMGGGCDHKKTTMILLTTNHPKGTLNFTISGGPGFPHIIQARQACICVEPVHRLLNSTTHQNAQFILTGKPQPTSNLRKFITTNHTKLRVNTTIHLHVANSNFIETIQGHQTLPVTKSNHNNLINDNLKETMLVHGNDNNNHWHTKYFHHNIWTYQLYNTTPNLLLIHHINQHKFSHQTHPTLATKIIPFNPTSVEIHNKQHKFDFILPHQQIYHHYDHSSVPIPDEHTPPSFKYNLSLSDPTETNFGQLRQHRNSTNHQWQRHSNFFSPVKNRKKQLHIINNFFVTNIKNPNPPWPSTDHKCFTIDNTHYLMGFEVFKPPWASSRHSKTIRWIFQLQMATHNTGITLMSNFFYLLGFEVFQPPWLWYMKKINGKQHLV